MYLTLDKNNSNQYYHILENDIKSLDFNTFSLQQEQLGVFTTFSTHIDKDKELGFFKFNEHLNRIDVGAKELGIQNKDFDIKQIIFEICKKHYEQFNQRQKVRIILRANGQIEITIEPYEKAQEKIHLISYQAKRELAQIKHTNISISLKANKKLKHNQEALLIDEDGNVLEGAWSNIFIIKNKKIFTPKNILSESKFLEGITRKAILELFQVERIKMRTEEVLNADEIFISKSTAGIVPVNKIDSSTIKKLEETNKLICKFNNFILENLECK